MRQILKIYEILKITKLVYFKNCLKISNLKFKIGITLLITMSFFFFPKTVKAIMSSKDYQLEKPNLNFSAGGVSSTDYKLGFTGGQTGSGPYSFTGYKLLAGFWYMKSTTPFRFSLSNQIIDFGILSSNTPATAATTMTVSAGAVPGYQVTVEENKQLFVDSTGAIIPDTTGDNGGITENTAGAWTNNTTYGFGYTIYGNDAVSPFPGTSPAGNLYKQFADRSKGEEAEIVMNSKKGGDNRSAVLVYKLNVSASQPAGQYHNVISYIAVPTY